MPGAWPTQQLERDTFLKTQPADNTGPQKLQVRRASAKVCPFD